MRKSFLFFTLLGLVILSQLSLLHWRAEAVFFVTWLFVALIVQHDSRVSAALGLAFLATCPFLLIAKRDAVAEQAANYAYFFLAIGVLVQFEELLLERYGWLGHKLDISYLWRPASEAFRRRWTAATQALGQQLAIADRAELVRLVQVVGAVGLAVVFLSATFTGERPALALTLLGGALLFPFAVWGLRLAVRAAGPARLLSALLALLLLPLAAAEMIWLYELVSADRLARMEVIYDFVDWRETARQSPSDAEGMLVEARMWTIEGQARRVLYQHPAFSGAGRLAYTVWVGRGYVLAFDIATAPESWEAEGDGVTFAVYIQPETDAQPKPAAKQVFSTYLDPKHDPAERRWHPVTLDLSAYAGQTVTLIFETGTGPAGDYRYDWAGWGHPRLLR